MADDHQVYASQETSERLGWITTYVPDLAQTDVLIITKDDLIARGRAMEQEDLLEPLSDEEPEEMRFARSGLSNWFNEMAESGVIEENIPQEITTYLTAGALTTVAYAYSFDFDKDGQNDFGIILAPSDDISAKDFTAGLTGFSADFIAEAPGTTTEFTAMAVWHEAKHISQPATLSQGHIWGYSSMPLPYEIDADQGAITTYLQAIEDGHALDPEFTSDWIEMRLVGSLPSQGTDMSILVNLIGRTHESIPITSHSTHFALDAEGEHPDITQLAGLDDEDSFQGQVKEELLGMIAANTIINGILGLDYLQNVALAEIRDNGELSEQSQKYLGSDEPLQISAHLVSQVGITKVGAQIVQDNPVRALAAGRAIQEANLLPELANDYIERMHAFFEEHGDRLDTNEEYLEAHEYFKKVVEEELQEALQAQQTPPTQPNDANPGNTVTATNALEAPSSP